MMLKTFAKCLVVLPYVDSCGMDADRRLFDFTEFWLISAPGERTCQQTWDVMNSVTSKQANLSTNFKFHIPDLKVFSVLFNNAS